MHEEIGTVAGVIWQALNSKGELSLAQLKRKVKGKTPLFGWAIGWLAREDKIVITPEKRSFRIRLRDAQASAVGASCTRALGCTDGVFRFDEARAFVAEHPLELTDIRRT